MKNKLILWIILALIIAAVSCKQRSTSIDIAGSTTVLPIVQAAAEVFMDKNPNINISIRGGGSGIGIKSTMNNSVDIGNSSREIKEMEAKSIEESQHDFSSTAIARDAITIITHNATKVKNLTKEQLRDIYLGEISNWKEVGGSDRQIIVISRDVSSGSYETFSTVIMDNSKMKTDCMILASNNSISKVVSYTPGAIGYVGIGFVTEKNNIVSLDTIYPSFENISNNSYLLSRKLYILTNQQNSAAVNKFIKFILSDEGQKIILKQGYLTIKQMENE